jgi:hypothetical protein
VWLKGQIKGTEFGAAGAPVEISNQKVFVSLRDCRPVEPTNSPEIPDSSSEPMRAAFETYLIQQMGWNQSYFSRNENRYFDSQVELIWQTFQAGARYGDPVDSPEIPDSSSEPMRAAFEAELIQEMAWNQSYFGRDENGYFDSQIEILWEDFQAGARYGDPSGGWAPAKDEIEYAVDRCGVPASDLLAPSPCMDGVDVDQFIEGIMETRGRNSDLLTVGDAVRFVLPGHKRHGTEGAITSIGYSGSKYRFDSNCGQFHRWCAIAELERIIKRYRTPTLADLASGSIACEYRDCDEEHWQKGFLVHILNGVMPFLCVNEEQELSGQWDECRIEVGE